MPFITASFITAQRLFPAVGEHGPCMRGRQQCPTVPEAVPATGLASTGPCMNKTGPAAMFYRASSCCSSQRPCKRCRLLRPAAAEKRGRAGRGQVIVGRDPGAEHESLTAACARDRSCTHGRDS